MQHGQTPDRGELWPADEGGFFWDVESAEQQGDEVVLRPPASYRQAFGDEPIRVGIVEFQIMLFLSRWPYHAYTRRQIAEAVSSEDRPVTEASVDSYVGSLRDQLGILHDFVQAVPHVGYRFKA